MNPAQSWIDAAHEAAPYVLAVLIATTVMVRALLPMARALERWATMTPAAWDDAGARSAVAILEWLAAATASVLVLLPRVTIGEPDTTDAQRSRRRSSKNRGPGAPGLALLFAVAACSGTASGCGASAYGTHARGATVAAASLSTVGSVVDAARDEALDRVEVEHPTRGPERNAALEAEAARWEPVGAALDAARAAVLAWVGAIELAQIAGDSGDSIPALLRLAARVALLYDRLVAVVQTVGITDVPPLPDVLRAIAQGWDYSSTIATEGAR